MILTLYLSRLLAARILAVLAGLLALGLTLDLLETSTRIIDSYGVWGLFRYTVLRAPLILSTILPLGVLVGAALAFLSLAMRHEMVVLRAAGYNTVRILLMLFPLALACGVAQSQLAVRLGPAAERAIVVEFPGMFRWAAIEGEVWLRVSDAVIRIGQAAADGATLNDISIFENGPDGTLTQRIDALAARFTRDGWQLEQATVALPNEAVKQVPEMRWATRLTPASIRGAARRPELVDASEMRQILSGKMPGGRGTPFYSVQLWRSYSAFFVPLVMFLFAAMASFGLSRSGGGIGRVSLGLLGGFFFILVDGVFSSLGEVGAMSAVLAAFLAPGLFFVIGLWTIVVIEE